MSATQTLSRRVTARATSLRLLRPDGFVLSLIGVVIVATTLPCDGRGARIFGALGTLAIASLFFLQGARLSREAIMNGLTHWRLHLVTRSEERRVGKEC